MNNSNSYLDNPPHPGIFIKIEVIDPLGLSVTETARALGITRQAMFAFLNQQTALSADMAIRLEKLFELYTKMTAKSDLKKNNLKMKA